MMITETPSIDPNILRTANKLRSDINLVIRLEDNAPFKRLIETITFLSKRLALHMSDKNMVSSHMEITIRTVYELQFLIILYGHLNKENITQILNSLKVLQDSLATTDNKLKTLN